MRTCPVFPGIAKNLEVLGFFETCVLFHELLLAIPGEAYGELELVSGALTPQHQTPSVLGMADVGAGKEVLDAGSADILAGLAG